MGIQHPYCNILIVSDLILENMIGFFLKSSQKYGDFGDNEIRVSDA